MTEQVPTPNMESKPKTSSPFEDMKVKLPSRLRIHQRMGHMPSRFQREVGPSIERLPDRLKQREMTAGELVVKLSTVIAESPLGVEAARDYDQGTDIHNAAVRHYMPKVLKQLIDNPVQRDAVYSVYVHARAAELQIHAPNTNVAPVELP